MTLTRATETHHATRDARWLLLACFLSGASGLVFEMAWFHRSGLVFGGSVWATSLVLSSFMGGLTVGSAAVAAIGHRIRTFLTAYAGVEIAVAVSGVTLTHALPGLTQTVVTLTRPATDHLWLTNLVLFGTSFAILLVPSTAMGATVPLLVAALTTWRTADMGQGATSFGAALGRVYGWNTLGAVAGVVGAEVVLVGSLGVAGSAWFAGLLSLTAAALALALTRRCAPVSPARSQARPTEKSTSTLGWLGPARVRAWPLLAGSFLSGGTLLALEVVWFRFLTMYVLSTSLAASLMLAVVLAAIGLGGLAASTWMKQSPQAPMRLASVALATGCSVAATYAGFQVLTDGVQIGAWHRMLWLAVVLTLPTSLLSGILFPLLGDALRHGIGAETRAAGALTLANTAGGMVGPLVAAFVMLPRLGMERSFFVLAAGYGLVAALSLAGAWPGRARLRSPAFALPVLALMGALAWFPFGLMNDAYFARVARPYMGDGSQIVATREGPSETILLMQQKWMSEPVYSRLVTNGFSMSGTAVPAMRYMRYFAYWPMLLHRDPIKRVLVVCYGVGVTASAALDLRSAELVDVVEISPDVVAMSDIIYPWDHPLRDPRVRLHIEDGRQYLLRTAEQYDLITGEPPPPRTPGAVNIYTREYFRLMYERLADGGIATYWLPVGRPDPGTNVSAIVRAFCDVFENCSLWNATPFDLMLVGSRGELSVSEARFTEPWGIPSLRARLAEVGIEMPQQVGATFLGDSSYLRRLTEGVEPLVDNHPLRLGPVPGKPSLSDPGYGIDAAVTALYQEALSPARARGAFAASDFIRRLLPERVIEASLPFFDLQAILNRVLWEGGQPLRQIDDLHRLLTRTPLRTLPLWILGSDEVRERIAARRDDDAGAVQYMRGLTALARRDYIGAAAAFAESERLGLKSDTVLPLHVYALCQAGRIEEARERARGVQVRGDEARHFWEWMGARFDLGPAVNETTRPQGGNRR